MAILRRAGNSIRAWMEAQAPGFASPPPVLVYQVGKVGSTSIVEALRSGSLPNKIFHAHRLTWEGRREAWRRYRKAGVGQSSRTRHLTETRGLAARVRWDPRAHWMVVSGFRDPIARAVAEFFQICEWAHPWVLEGGSVSPDKATRYLLSQISSQSSLLTRGWSWFETELIPAFGIDPLNHPFDRSRGWEILDTGRVRVLL